MAVVVFDADVLIAFLRADDVHHAAAVDRVAEASQPGMRRLVSAVTYSEILVGPLCARGPEAAEQVKAMLVRFAFETIPVDMTLAERAAAVRARTDLKLPDAYVVATAMHGARRSEEDVEIASFDEGLAKAYAAIA